MTLKNYIVIEPKNRNVLKATNKVIGYCTELQGDVKNIE